MQLDRTIPARFLKTAYRDDDLIAIAYRCLSQESRSSDTVDKPAAPKWHHRFVTAARACAPDYLAWLRHLNANGNDIFVSMNTFASPLEGRTEANVNCIRHIYADFDAGGAHALRALRARNDLPRPSYVVHSSEDRFQVIWNVIDFEREYAKALLCHLAYTLGSDTAVHDTNRVLRLPGFRNHKYRPAPLVTLEIEDPHVHHQPRAFPVPAAAPRAVNSARPSASPRGPLPGTIRSVTRSERDWATVRSALAAQQPWQDVVRDLIRERPDKPKPVFYACLTVLNALKSLGRPEPPELVEALKSSKGTSTPVRTANGPNLARTHSESA